MAENHIRVAEYAKHQEMQRDRFEPPFAQGADVFSAMFDGRKSYPRGSAQRHMGHGESDKQQKMAYSLATRKYQQLQNPPCFPKRA